MPTIDEMLARSTDFGFIGGQRTRQEDTRTQQKHDVDLASSKVDLYTKSAELDDYLEGRQLRRKERTVKEQQADRAITNKGLLDEEYEEKLRLGIEDTKRTRSEALLYDAAKQFSGVTTQEQYDQMREVLPYGMLRRLGIDDESSWEKAGPKVARWLDVAMADEDFMKEMMKLRLESQARVQAARASVPTPPLPPTPSLSEITAGGIAQIQSQPGLKQAFDQNIIQKTAGMIQSLWNTGELRWDSASYNENLGLAAEQLSRITQRRIFQAENAARLYQKSTGKVIQVDSEAEQAQAMMDLKAHLHKFPLGASEISYMTPREAEADKERLMGILHREELKNTNPLPALGNKRYSELSPEERSFYLEKLYYANRRVNYERALNAVASRAATR